MKFPSAYQPSVSLATIARLALLGGLSTVFLAAQVSTTSVNRFSDRSTVAGASSTLVRNDAGVTLTVITSDLDAGATYTIWWIIFNNPDACAMAGACAGSDLAPRGGDLAVQSSVQYATGQIVSGTGTAGFAAHLAPGDATGVRFGPGLIDPTKAEIHVVVRTHGQPIPGMTDEQIGSFNGGCPPNTCEDHQFAIHIPGEDQVSQSVSNIEVTVEAIKELEERIARALSINP